MNIYLILKFETQITTREMREKVMKNLGEMFGDFNQSFHREVTIDRENEQ